MTDAQLTVCALFVLHTHLAEYCMQTPYIFISSPEKECGKSRLMEVLALLAARPWGPIVTPSEAVLFRIVHAKTPTLLWDEIDTVFSPKSAPFHEGHRALLDQGHRRYGSVPRFINNRLVEFNVFCPKVFAGIGALPDTVAGRSIPMRLQRRSVSESVEDFITQDVEPIAEQLHERIEKWAAEHGESVGSTRPEAVPPELSDRMKEGCFSLLAIADHFGIGAEGRAALVELLGAERVDSQETMRLRLLRDILAVFKTRVRHGHPVAAIRTEHLLGALFDMDESPWASYYSRGLEAKDLADLLRPYEIHSQLIKFRVARGEFEAARGYRREPFKEHVGLVEVWERYLGEDEFGKVTR